MPKLKRLAAVVLLAVLLGPTSVPAADLVEQAGVGIGVTAGNLWFVPVKAISVVWGLAAGGLAYVMFGDDDEMARQVWEDTSQGPYLITPEIARAAVGTRPELGQD